MIRLNMSQNDTVLGGTGLNRHHARVCKKEVGLMKRFVVLIIAACLAACAGLIGPRTVEVPLQKLQERLDKRVLLSDTRLMGLIDVRLGRPILSLDPQRQRVALAIDAALTPILATKGISGSFTISGRLEIDAPRNAVLLREPKLERLSLEGITAERQADYTKVARVLVDRVSTDIVVHQIDPNDLRRAGIQFYPSRIDVRDNALAIILTPEK
jgi:hypothetical protein